jgi:hypothetical protein
MSSLLLTWKRDPLLDTFSADAGNHSFLCMRTYLDVAVLYHNGKEVRRSSDGSHKINMDLAQKIYDEGVNDV